MTPVTSLFSNFQGCFGALTYWVFSTECNLCNLKAPLSSFWPSHSALLPHLLTQTTLLAVTQAVPLILRMTVDLYLLTTGVLSVCPPEHRRTH